VRGCALFCSVRPPHCSYYYHSLHYLQYVKVHDNATGNVYVLAESRLSELYKGGTEAKVGELARVCVQLRSCAGAVLFV
jgi:hypothetical protein